MSALFYYWFCIRWLWKNRDWADTRQKYKAMNRDYSKWLRNRKRKRGDSNGDDELTKTI